MPIPILTDKEKILKWNDICMTRNWSRQGELQTWLHANNIKFARSGSVLVPAGPALKVTAPSVAKGLITNTPCEIMATHILSVYSGKIIFASTEIEAIFWKEVIDRMSREFDSFMQPDLVPTNVRNILKYPGDGDGNLPT